LFSLKIFESDGEKTLQGNTMFLAILPQGIKKAIFLRVNDDAQLWIGIFCE
jgi:hypothetical protein